MGQTRAIQVICPDATQIQRLPFLPIEAGQVVELSPRSANTSAIQVGQGTYEAALRGPFVAYLDKSGVPRIVVVESTDELFVKFGTTGDVLLVMVRDPNRYEKTSDAANVPNTDGYRPAPPAS